MQVDGMDIATRTYRIRLDDAQLVGLLPETLVAESLGLSARPRHGDVYRWLATHSTEVDVAIRALASGRRPKPPLDQITLEEMP